LPGLGEFTYFEKYAFYVICNIKIGCIFAAVLNDENERRKETEKVLR
jgi:hypothetical protein